MRKLLLMLLLLSTILTFSSCEKDPCETTTCLNGGVCIDGDCDCPDGYSGPQCESFNACFSVICLNGGNCVNGACNCLEGYTGSDCSQQVTPSKIRINRIEVIRFPATDNGAGWDLSSGPDIYPIISKNNSVIWEYPNFIQNANPSNNHNFSVNPVFDLESPNDQYGILLYDYDDFDADDFMGGINFTPYRNNNGFPTTLNIDAGGDVAFKVYVSYIW
jgi:hypothetical protein